jgi:hypothetical protein
MPLLPDVYEARWFRIDPSSVNPHDIANAEIGQAFKATIGLLALKLDLQAVLRQFLVG